MPIDDAIRCRLCAIVRGRGWGEEISETARKKKNFFTDVLESEITVADRYRSTVLSTGTGSCTVYWWPYSYSYVLTVRLTVLVRTVLVHCTGTYRYTLQYTSLSLNLTTVLVQYCVKLE